MKLKGSHHVDPSEREPVPIIPLWDLYYLLSSFTKIDAAFAHAGIRSLRAHFGQAMATDPDDLSPDQLFDVLECGGCPPDPSLRQALLPQRHRRDRRGGAAHPLPTPIVLRVSYDREAVLPGFTTRSQGTVRHLYAAARRAGNRRSRYSSIVSFPGGTGR
jgi:hypothetical protein